MMRYPLLLIGLLTALALTACGTSAPPPANLTPPSLTSGVNSGGHRHFTLNGTNVGYSNAAAPTIGQTLNASTGTWGRNPFSYTYQWQDCDVLGHNCTNIAGATTSSYTIANTDNDLAVRVVVTASNGSGSASSPSAATRPSIVNHIPNWAYDDACNGGAGASAALVRAWVNNTEDHCSGWTVASPGKVVTDCVASGVTFCLPTPYVDTQIIFSATPPGTLLTDAQENWFLHESAPNQATRLTTTAFGGGFLLNQNIVAYQQWWRNFINQSFPGADALFMDDQFPTYPFFGLSDTASNEVTSVAELQAMHTAISNALINTTTGQPFAQADNTIPDCGNFFESSQGLGASGNLLTGPVDNLVAEGCPSQNGTLIGFYDGILDDMAWINANTSGSLTLLSFGAAGAGYQTQERLMQLATLLLGYSPGHVEDWSELEQGNVTLSVFPESGIVPTNPVQTMGNPTGSGCLTLNTSNSCPTGGHNDVQTATTGVYRREFQKCYNQGTLIGRCAAVVNTTASAVTVTSGMLSQTYAHSLTVSGGDVQAGGTVNVSGATFTAGTTQVAADSALILTP